MNQVERLRGQVDAAFEEASMRLTQAIRVIVADHSHKGSIRSSATIRRIVQAAEVETRSAVERSRELIAGSKSVILRTRLAEFTEIGVGRIRVQVTDRLGALDLGDHAGQVLLNEALARAQRLPPEPIATRLDRARKSVTKFASYIGHNVLLVIATAVLTAVILKAMNLD